MGQVGVHELAPQAKDPESDANRALVQRHLPRPRPHRGAPRRLDVRPVLPPAEDVQPDGREVLHRTVTPRDERVLLQVVARPKLPLQGLPEVPRAALAGQNPHPPRDGVGALLDPNSDHVAELGRPEPGREGVRGLPVPQVPGGAEDLDLPPRGVVVEAAAQAPDRTINPPRVPSRKRLQRLRPAGRLRPLGLRLLRPLLVRQALLYECPHRVHHVPGLCGGVLRAEQQDVRDAAEVPLLGHLVQGPAHVPQRAGDCHHDVDGDERRDGDVRRVHQEERVCGLLPLLDLPQLLLTRPTKEPRALRHARVVLIIQGESLGVQRDVIDPTDQNDEPAPEPNQQWDGQAFPHACGQKLPQHNITKAPVVHPEKAGVRVAAHEEPSGCRSIFSSGAREEPPVRPARGLGQTGNLVVHGGGL
mmetsp:Transcript_4163/g.14541  ORF Transcript_4163/g.14541 Transcript_4163/m.14541 type:complete len:417 (-) Transcript_4163:174-1424(-)